MPKASWPRARLDLLLDPGTFNDLEPFITHPGDELGIATEKYLGDGAITLLNRRRDGQYRHHRGGN